VGGTQSSEIGTTGAGLNLGDDLNLLKRTYGSRFKSDYEPDDRPAERKDFTGVPGVRQIFLQWRSEDFSLIVGFDSTGKIIGMQLFPPECLPGGCK
jgi:hypothetical protein